MPEGTKFQTKGEIALDQITAARVAGIPPAVVLADAGYGTSTPLRSRLTEFRLAYVVGVLSSISVRPPGMAPLPPTDKGRFAAVRVRPANADHKHSEAREVEWLLIEWPPGDDEPSKYWLSTVSEETALKALVDHAKLRWRIERDNQDLKQEIGIGHYEGSGWRGFHHHETLCIAAYGFLICEADVISLSGGKIGQRANGKTCPSPRLATPWRRQYALNAMSDDRSRPWAERSQTYLQKPMIVAHAATDYVHPYDVVGLVTRSNGNAHI